MHERLYTALYSLTEDKRQIITHIYFGGTTERELAALMALSHTAIHKRKLRNLTKLKDILKEFEIQGCQNALPTWKKVRGLFVGLGGRRMLTQERIYTLIVKGQRIPVTQAVYKAYYQEYEHERNLSGKAAKHECSWEQLVEAGVSIDFYCVGRQCPVEDTLLATEQVGQLRDCLFKLPSKDQAILVGIFFYDQSARELAGRLGVSPSAVGYRKQKALQKPRLALSEKVGCEPEDYGL